MDNWAIRTLGTSVGKKQLMAVTGVLFTGFLMAHLAGNLTIFLGRDSFDAYAKRLNALGPLLTLAELGLVFLACVHVSMGLLLFYQNLKARPARYAGKKWAGGRTVFSATMPYTGFLVLLFVLVHLATFRFADLTPGVFAVSTGVFRHAGYVVYFTFSVAAVAFHVRHGLWSAFQTVGANHPKYMPAVEAISALFALAAGLGFGLLPTVFFMMA